MNSSNSLAKYEALASKETKKLLEDAYCGVFMVDPPMSMGHIKIIAKQEGTLDSLPDEMVERIFVYANVVASSLFELLQAQGTNIIFEEWVRSGPDPHAILHVIPRFQGEMMNFLWQPQRLEEGIMKQAQDKIKDKTFMMSYKPEKKEVRNLDNPPKPEELSGKLKEEVERHLRRTP